MKPQGDPSVSTVSPMGWPLHSNQNLHVGLIHVQDDAFCIFSHSSFPSNFRGQNGCRHAFDASVAAVHPGGRGGPDGLGEMAGPPGHSGPDGAGADGLAVVSVSKGQRIQGRRKVVKHVKDVKPKIGKKGVKPSFEKMILNDFLDEFGMKN